jgi:hypothetical protein
MINGQKIFIYIVSGAAGLTIAAGMYELFGCLAA